MIARGWRGAVLAIGLATAVMAAGWCLRGSLRPGSTGTHAVRWTGPDGAPMPAGWIGCGEANPDFDGLVVDGRMLVHCAAGRGFPYGALGRIDPARGRGEVLWPLPVGFGVDSLLGRVGIVGIQAGPRDQLALVTDKLGVLGERGWTHDGWRHAWYLRLDEVRWGDERIETPGRSPEMVTARMAPAPPRTQAGRGPRSCSRAAAARWRTPGSIAIGEPGG